MEGCLVCGKQGTFPYQCDEHCYCERHEVVEMCPKCKLPHKLEIEHPEYFDEIVSDETFKKNIIDYIKKKNPNKEEEIEDLIKQNKPLKQVYYWSQINYLNDNDVEWDDNIQWEYIFMKVQIKIFKEQAFNKKLLNDISLECFEHYDKTNSIITYEYFWLMIRVDNLFKKMCNFPKWKVWESCPIYIIPFYQFSSRIKYNPSKLDELRDSYNQYLDTLKYYYDNKNKLKNVIFPNIITIKEIVYYQTFKNIYFDIGDILKYLKFICIGNIEVLRLNLNNDYSYQNIFEYMRGYEYYNENKEVLENIIEFPEIYSDTCKYYSQDTNFTILFNILVTNKELFKDVTGFKDILLKKKKYQIYYVNIHDIIIYIEFLIDILNYNEFNNHNGIYFKLPPYDKFKSYCEKINDFIEGDYIINSSLTRYFFITTEGPKIFFKEKEWDHKSLKEFVQEKDNLDSRQRKKMREQDKRTKECLLSSINNLEALGLTMTPNEFKSVINGCWNNNTLDYNCILGKIKKEEFPFYTWCQQQSVLGKKGNFNEWFNTRQKEEEEICVICQENLYNDEILCKPFKCDHKFHCNCIPDTQQKCPLCKREKLS